MPGPIDINKYNNMSEVFRSVVGFEGEYEISSMGCVISVARAIVRSNGAIQTFKKKQIKINVNQQGYAFVMIHRKRYTVHRLVMNAFVENTHNKPCINHKNGIKTDNRLENLEWVTHKENLDHAIEMGLKRSLDRNNHPNRIKIKSINPITGEEKEFQSLRHAASELHLGRQNISLACNNHGIKCGGLLFIKQ